MSSFANEVKDLLGSTDIKEALHGVTVLNDRLLDEQIQWDSKTCDAVVDRLVDVMNLSNFKIHQQALQALLNVASQVDDRCQQSFQVAIEPLLQRMADAKKAVRSDALEVMMQLMHSFGPQWVLSKILLHKSWIHKNALIREHTATVVYQASKRFGISSVSLKEWVPAISKLVADQNPGVRIEAFSCMKLWFSQDAQILTSAINQADLPTGSSEHLFKRLHEECKPGSSKTPRRHSVGSSLSSTSMEDTDNLEDEQKVAKKRRRSTSSAKEGTRSRSVGRSVSRSPPRERSRSRSRSRKSLSGLNRSSPTSKSSPRSGRNHPEREMELDFTESVSPVPVYCDKELEQHMRTINETCKDVTSFDWKERIAALHRLCGLVAGGAASLGSFLPHLFNLKDSLAVQVSELRSAVCREACATLCFLSRSLTDNFEAVADFMLPVLLKLSYVSINVIAESGRKTALTIIKHTRVNKAVGKLLNGTKETNDALRTACMQYLLLILQVQGENLDKHADGLESVIKQTLSDKSGDVRSFSRKCYWAFRELWEQRADRLFKGVDTRTQKHIMDEVDSWHMAPPKSPEPFQPAKVQPKPRVQKKRSEPKKVASPPRSPIAQEEIVGGSHRVESEVVVPKASRKPTVKSILGMSAGPSRSAVANVGSTIANTKEHEPKASAGLRAGASRRVRPQEQQEVTTTQHASASLNISGSDEQQKKKPRNTHTKAASREAIATLSELACMHPNQPPSLIPVLSRTTASAQVTSADVTATRKASTSSSSSSTNSIAPTTTRLAKILENAQTTTWSIRASAFEQLIAYLDSPANATLHSEVAVHLDQLVAVFEDKCGDTHHKVAHLALSALDSFLKCTHVTQVEAKSYLERLLPSVFMQLTNSKTSIQQQANQILNSLAQSWNVELLLGVLLRVLDRSVSHKVKLGCLELIVYLLPSSNSYFDTPLHMKAAVNKITPYVLDAQKPKTRKIAISILVQLHAQHSSAFYAHATTIEIQKWRKLQMALADAIPELERRLAIFSKQAGKPKSQDSQEVEMQQPAQSLEQTKEKVVEVAIKPSNPASVYSPRRYQDENSRSVQNENINVQPKAASPASTKKLKAPAKPQNSEILSNLLSSSVTLDVAIELQGFCESKPVASWISSLPAVFEFLRSTLDKISADGLSVVVSTLASTLPQLGMLQVDSKRTESLLALTKSILRVLMAVPCKVSTNIDDVLSLCATLCSAHAESLMQGLMPMLSNRSGEEGNGAQQAINMISVVIESMKSEAVLAETERLVAAARQLYEEFEGCDP
eukprot:CAMPEP_0175136278 /NCGR_PEP_ID=MMETSP0087-20121206/9187_1 /TAXON_ID=136419 /ORGANISM="Unknown Unknown, Strain D1" /LENGTH=1287 /DNA_ID=CAMNT_0016419017 /DNA_START=72 /DNA_END=3934 /DNA_ORIENTATION=-